MSSDGHPVDLEGYPKAERERREAILTAYTDRDYVLAPWVRQQLRYENPLRDGFVPKGSDVRDFCIIRSHADGRYHVFYIDVRHGKSSRRPDNIHFIGHATTADFLSWDVHEPALFIVPGTWEGCHVTAPHVIEIEPEPRFDRLVGGPARYAMFYVGQPSSLAQMIGMAVSSDLKRWVRYEGNPIFHPGHCPWAAWSKSKLANCRDPHAMKIGSEYFLYYTALRKNADTCVAVATSRDLEDWTDRGPVLTKPIADRSPGMTESACVHRLAGDSDAYVLFYSHDGGTRYSISNDPLRFDNSDAGALLVDGFWGLELVHRSGDQWLVALFRAQTSERPGAIHLGTIRWTGPRPIFTLIDQPEQLGDFRTVIETLGAGQAR